MSKAKSSKRVEEEKEDNVLSTLYLFTYNAVQVGGWSYILYLLAKYYLVETPVYKSANPLWDVVKLPVIVFQNAAALEIANAVFGLVKSNPVITTFQVLSRMMVVCGVVMATPSAKISPGLPIALSAWCITEIIRYGYYALNIIKYVPKIVVWLRYTTFIALYPIGVTGELLCFYWAQKFAGDHPNHWSMEMPNRYNATFSYFYLLWIVMFMYIPLFPQMYLHMFAQRKKILGGGGRAAAVDKAKKSH